MNIKVSSLLFVLVILMSGGFFYSCSKDSGTTTTTKTDSLTKLQILTQKTWEVDQLIHVISCQYSTYTRGASNTTGINYDNLRFVFKTDGTGTTTDASGNTLPLTWQFATTDQRTITLTVNSTTPYTWNMVEIVGKYLHATAGPLTVSGNSNNMESFRLVQVP